MSTLRCDALSAQTVGVKDSFRLMHVHHGRVWRKARGGNAEGRLA